jgi:hypothetical protein
MLEVLDDEVFVHAFAHEALAADRVAGVRQARCQQDPRRVMVDRGRRDWL